MSRICDSERTITDLRCAKFCVIIIIIILLGAAPCCHKFVPIFFFNFCAQSALKLAYVHLSVKKFFRGYTPDPSFKWREEGKTGVGLEGIEGREWKDEEEAKEGEGIREDIVPLN
jgi:hypothetical protein